MNLKLGNRKVFVLALSLALSLMIGAVAATGRSAVAVTTAQCGTQPYNIAYVGQDLILISTANGLFKATNTGWDFVNSTEWYLPTVGTGGSLYFYTQPDIQQSLDGGDSWTSTGVFTSTELNAYEHLFASPLTNTIFMNVAYGWVYTGPYSGTYKSSDSGLTWRKVITGNNDLPVVFSPNFAADGVAFTGSNTVWKTTDWGETWFAVLDLARTPLIGSQPATATPAFTPPPVHLLISPQFIQDQTVFRIFSGEVWKSTDGGVTWLPGATVPNSWFQLGAAISPDYLHDQTLVAADESAGIFISRDGAQSWQRVNSPFLQPITIGLRLKRPLNPWPPVPSVNAGVYQVYLPIVQSVSLDQVLEIWTYGGDEALNPHLMHSSDLGLSWQEPCIFEIQYWQYLPIINQVTSNDR